MLTSLRRRFHAVFLRFRNLAWKPVTGICHKQNGDFMSGDFMSFVARIGDFLSGDFMSGDFLVGDFMSYVARIEDFLSGDFMSGDFLTWIHFFMQWLQLYLNQMGETSLFNLWGWDICVFSFVGTGIGGLVMWNCVVVLKWVHRVSPQYSISYHALLFWEKRAFC